MRRQPSKFPKKNSILFTTSLCGKVFAATFLFFISLMVFAFGLYKLNDSGSLQREHEVRDYIKDESLWNTTYRGQLEGITAAVIVDLERYTNQIQQSEIGLVQQLYQGQEALENIQGVDERWKAQQNLLKIQELIKNITKVNTAVRQQLTIQMEPSSKRHQQHEEHLVNRMDQHDNLPEYDPYSLISSDYYPDGQKQIIKSEEEFRSSTRHKTRINVLIQEAEITKSNYEKGVDQILEIDVPLLKVVQTRVTKYPQKSQKNKDPKVCQRTGGHLNMTVSTCTHFYYASQLCVSIKKGRASDLYEWKLSGYNNSKSYGCGFNPEHQIRDQNINQVQVWTKVPIDNQDEMFPMAIPPLQVHLRHANDPLLAAIHISKNGLLSFGESTNEKMVSGVIMCTISGIAFLVTLSYFISICCPDSQICVRSNKYKDKMVEKEKDRDRSEQNQIEDDVGQGKYEIQNQEENFDSARGPRPANFSQKQRAKFKQYKASDIIIEQPDFDSDDDEAGNTNRDMSLNLGNIQSSGRDEVEFSFR